MHHSGPGNLLQFQERFYPQDLLHDEAEELLGIWKGREKQGSLHRRNRAAKTRRRKFKEKFKKPRKISEKFRKIQETKQ